MVIDVKGAGAANKARGADVESYLQKLGNLECILTGNYTSVGTDIYQANRLRKALFSQDGLKKINKKQQKIKKYKKRGWPYL